MCPVLTEPNLAIKTIKNLIWVPFLAPSSPFGIIIGILIKNMIAVSILHIRRLRPKLPIGNLTPEHNNGDSNLLPQLGKNKRVGLALSC